jgi:hypothetical protein
MSKTKQTIVLASEMLKLYAVTYLLHDCDNQRLRGLGIVSALGVT